MATVIATVSRPCVVLRPLQWFYALCLDLYPVRDLRALPRASGPDRLLFLFL